MFHLGRLWHCLQTLNKVATEKHSSLVRTFVNFACTKFYNVGPRCQSYKKISSSLMKRLNNLERLYLKSLSSLVYLLLVGIVKSLSYKSISALLGYGLMALLGNIRPSWKVLQRANALAYSATPSVTRIESFISFSAERKGRNKSSIQPVRLRKSIR